MLMVACGSVHTILLTTDGDVFVWGRNMDGQLGIGSRQDERIPRMLTKINDHLIVCVKSGGEYNVALDTVNQMWVWGKNDAGQLGLQISGSSGNIRPHRVMSHRRSHSGSAIDPIVPVILKGLPAQDPSSPSPWQQSLMASSDSGDSELWISEDINEDRHLMMMPYLEKVGKVKYNKKVVSAVVKYLSHLFSTASVLRKCIDIGDWLTAADICILDENYGQALSYHLDALNERTSVMSPDKLRHFSIQLVQHHIKLCINKTASRTEREGELKFIVLEVMKHWEKNRLSISELEMVFVNHLSSLAYSLSFALFRSQNCQSTKEEANDATILGPSAAFIQQFSTKFCLHVLHAVLAAAAMDPEKGFKDWKKVVKLPELIDSTESVRIELQSSDKLIPYDRLWQDVIQNLRKHSDLRDYISITRNEMDHLEVQVEDQMDVDSGKSGLAVLFTCGHHFTKRTFTDEVLKSFEKELMEGPRKLPYSASLLCQYYTRQGLLPLACPKCVLNALATIS